MNVRHVHATAQRGGGERHCRIVSDSDMSYRGTGAKFLSTAGGMCFMGRPSVPMDKGMYVPE